MSMPLGSMTRFSVLGAALVSIASLAVLAGWQFSVATLTSILPHSPRMSALTALSFTLAGLSLALLTAEDRKDWGSCVLSRAHTLLRSGAVLCGVLVTLIAALRLADHLVGWPLEPDLLWFDPQGQPPARMAPATAFAFLMTGIALLLAPRPHPVRLSQLLAVGIGLLGWLGVSRYLYGGEPLLPFAQMAVHTAALFLLLSLSLLALRLDSGLMALLSSDTRGGTVARALVPAILIAPIVLGWLRLQGQRLGWFGTEAGVSLFALGNMVVFGVLVWTTAARLDRAEIQRRRAESEGREGQQLLQAIADNSPAVIYAKDLAGRYLFVNRRFEDLFGLTRETVIGGTDHSIFPKEIADAFRVMDQRAAQAEHALVEEEVAPLADGLHTYLSVKCRLRDASGRPYATIGVSTDISERKTGEEALRQSEERFRTLAESLPQLVWTCRADGWCDFLSRQWIEYTGHGVAEQLGYGWAEHIHPEDRPRVQTQWEGAVQSGDVFDVEFRLRRKDSVFRWFRTRAIALRDANGTIQKWFGTNTDVEDYKRSETRLHSQIAHLDLLDRTTRAIADRQDLGSIARTVLRSIEDHLPADFGCICTYERARESLTVLCVGTKSLPLAAQLNMQELSSIEIEGNGLARCVRGEVVYEPDVLAVNFPFPQRLAEGGLRAFVATPLLVESEVFGVMMIARREAASFESPDCEFLRQLSVHVGLAAHQAQLYGALQRAYDDLRQTQKAVLQQERMRVVGQMASGIAHDINNALSPAALYAQSILETEPGLNERSRGYLKIIHRAIDDVAQTVTRLREFYRPQEAEQQLAVNVNRTLEQVMELTKVRWQDMPQQRGIVICAKVELDPKIPAIAASESELRDALTNLVINAIDAMPEGGVLTLRSRSLAANNGRGASVLIEIGDTGVGMDEATRLRCLEPFFTTKGERGTGLGLAMVCGMAQRHGGELAVDSAPGAGTTMRLIFPAAVSELVTATDTVTLHRLPASLRVLLVDDDPLVRESLAAILQGDGHSIVEADGGQAGIDAFRASQLGSEPIAAVITDLGMPHVDGSRVAAQIKRLSPQTPVILLTGWGNRLLAENELPENVDRVLGKPPKLNELRAALAEIAPLQALDALPIL